MQIFEETLKSPVLNKYCNFWFLTGNSNHLSIQFQKVRSINKGYNHCFQEVKTDQ